MFCSSGDREVRDTDPWMAATPTTSELSGSTRHRGVQRGPLDECEQAICPSSLGRPQALENLDAADLGTHRSIIEADEVFAGRI